MDIYPRGTLAALAREAVEAHGNEWDSPHVLATVYPDGEKLRYGTVAFIDTAIHPTKYPSLIAERAAAETAESGKPYALLLQVEAFGAAEPGPDASPQDKALYEADRQARTIHLRKDASEAVQVFLADIHGRLWMAQRRRDSDQIEEQFRRPGQPPPGPVPAALLRAAAL